MDMTLRIVAIAFGAALVVVALASAIKTVVVPRASVSIVTRGVFLAVRRVFRVFRARPCRPRSGTAGWRGTPRSAWSRSSSPG